MVFCYVQPYFYIVCKEKTVGVLTVTVIQLNGGILQHHDGLKNNLCFYQRRAANDCCSIKTLLQTWMRLVASCLILPTDGCVQSWSKPSQCGVLLWSACEWSEPAVPGTRLAAILPCRPLSYGLTTVQTMCFKATFGGGLGGLLWLEPSF